MGEKAIIVILSVIEVIFFVWFIFERISFAKKHIGHAVFSGFNSIKI